MQELGVSPNERTLILLMDAFCSYGGLHYADAVSIPPLFLYSMATIVGIQATLDRFYRFFFFAGVYRGKCRKAILGLYYSTLRVWYGHGGLEDFYFLI